MSLLEYNNNTNDNKSNNNNNNNNGDNNNEKLSDELFSTKDLFDSAVSIVRNLPKDGPFQPSNELKLKFYAFYKQATEGSNTTKKPLFYRIVDCHKWESWKKLGNLPKEDAMKCYIEELKKVMDSLPAENGEHFSANYFEDILGRKFYLYWLKRFEVKKGGRKVNGKQKQQHQLSDGDAVSLTSNDEFATSSTSDGYKTPIASELKANLMQMNPSSHMFLHANNPLSDQIATSILRLQTSLDTNKRMTIFESRLKQTQSRVTRLELLAFVMAFLVIAMQIKKLGT